MSGSTALRRWAPLTITLVIIGLLLVYVTQSEVLTSLNITALRWQYLIPLLFLQSIYYGLLGLILATFVAQSGVHLRFREWYGLAIMSTVSNLVLPVSGGAMLRAGYLKARHGFSIANFSAVLAATYLVIFAVSGFTGFWLLAVLAWKAHTAPLWAGMGITAGMVVGPTLFILLPVERLPLSKENRFLRWVSRVLDGWRQIRTSPRLLLWQIGLAFGLQGVHAASLQMAFFSLDQPIVFIDAFLMSVLTNLSTVIRLTPGGIGMTEAATGLSATLLGMHMAEGVAAALIVRLTGWAVAFTSAPMFTFLLSESALSAGSADEDSEQLPD